MPRAPGTGGCAGCAGWIVFQAWMGTSTAFEAGAPMALLLELYIA